MDERIYGVSNNALGGYTAKDISKLPSKEKVEMMVNWFHENYEDPVNRTPYESAEGGYIWIWGGPYSADECIQDEFSEVIEYEIIEKAVEEIEINGLFEWAPTERPGDYEQNDGDIGHVILEPEARHEVIVQLAILNELITPLIEKSGLMGHNKPPVLITNDNPFSSEDLHKLKKDISIIREQTETNGPDITKLTQSKSQFQFIIRKLSEWIKIRIEKGIDTYIHYTVASLALSQKIDIQNILEALQKIIQALGNWITSLPMF